MRVVLTTLNAKYIHKNLALRYLYTTRPDNVECEVKEFTIKEGIEKITNELLAMNADIIGISTYIWNVEQTKVLCTLLKQNNPNLTIILGGPEVSFEPLFFLDNFMVDAISCGEGDFTIWEYVKNYKLETYDIDGIYTRNITPTKPYAYSDMASIETYTNPYFLEMDKRDMHSHYLYIETSRGCPYKCSYCLSSVLGNVRLFSLTYVKKILDDVFKSDVKQIKFLDRTFNVDKDRALEIAKYISENAKRDQIFQFEIMVEYISDELINYIINRPRLPKFRFEIGIQTTNQDALKSINRYQNFERLKIIINKMSENHNCEMHVDLIAGLPMENLRSFHNTFDDVFYLKADEIQLGFLKILRGTKLKNKADEYGLIYDEYAPYEVSTTPWLNNADMQVIHNVSYALDVLYNKPRMKDTLDFLISNYQLSPFSLFEILGLSLIDNKALQLHILFKQVYEILCATYDGHLIAGLLSIDYYRLFKQKTKRFIDFEISKETRNRCLDLLVNSKIGNINDLVNYGIFADGYYDNKAGYLYVLYNSKQILPNLYFINAKISNLNEIKGEVLCE